MNVLRKNSDENSETVAIKTEEILQNHKVLCEITDKKLSEILINDQFLSDIPYDITVEEIKEQIGLIKGQFITLFIDRGEELAPFRILIPESKSTTVLDVKTAIQRHYELEQKRILARGRQLRKSHQNYRKIDKTKISWRYIWRTYFLDYDGARLINNHHFLCNYNIRHKAVIKFVKKNFKNK